MGGWIIATIAALLSQIPEKNAGDRARFEFVWRGRGGVWIASAAEDSKMIISGRNTVEKAVGRVVGTAATRAAIEQVGRGGESVGPER
jgi:hypothetical protein